MKALIGLLVLGAVAWDGGTATWADSLPPGSRVRVDRRGGEEGPPARGRHEGRLVWEDAEVLVVESEAGVRTSIRRESIEHIHRSVGRHSRRRGVLVGAGVGAALGMLSTLVWSATTEGDAYGVGTKVGLFVYTPLASLVGAGVGAVIPPGERWEPVGAKHLFVRLESRPRGVGLAVGLGF